MLVENSPNVLDELGLLVELESHPFKVEIELCNVLSQVANVRLH